MPDITKVKAMVKKQANNRFKGLYFYQYTLDVMKTRLVLGTALN